MIAVKKQTPNKKTKIKRGEFDKLGNASTLFARPHCHVTLQILLVVLSYANYPH